MTVVAALDEAVQGVQDPIVALVLDAGVWLATDMLDEHDLLVGTAYLAVMWGAYVVSARVEDRPGWRNRIVEGVFFAVAVVFASFAGFRLFTAAVAGGLVEPGADGGLNPSFFLGYAAVLASLYVVPAPVRTALALRRKDSAAMRAGFRDMAGRAAVVAVLAALWFL